jgi:hypothetical protein
LSICWCLQGELQQLLQQFAQLVNVWRAMVAHGATLEYHAAAEVITTSEALGKAFYKQCEKVRSCCIGCMALFNQL